jgi:hypothetical protein
LIVSKIIISEREPETNPPMMLRFVKWTETLFHWQLLCQQHHKLLLFLVGLLWRVGLLGFQGSIKQI